MRARMIAAVAAAVLMVGSAAFAAQVVEGAAPVPPQRPGGDQAPPGPAAEPKGAAQPKAPEAKGEETGYLAYKESGPPESPSMTGVVSRVLGSLAIVVGLIFLTGLVLRRYLGGAKAPTSSRKVSELVEATPLGGKRVLYVIRVADRLLVVGAGGEQLTLLSEITDPEVLAQVAAAPRRSDFFEMFRRTKAEADQKAATEERGGEA